MTTSNTVSVTLQLPKIKGYKYTGEYRTPEAGEYYKSLCNNEAITSYGFADGPRFILTPEPKKLWRAEAGQYYWIFNQFLEPMKLEDCRDVVDTVLYNAHNYFQTKAQAQAASDRIIQLLQTINPADQ